MSRLRRLLKDDIDSFDLESLVMTAAILLFCLVGVSLVQKDMGAELNSSALIQETRNAP